MRNKKLYAYIAKNIEDFNILAPLAKDIFNKTRKPLYEISYALSMQMEARVEEWCDENDENPDVYKMCIEEYL